MMKHKRPGYARTTITVPRELKRRMKAVSGSVNWSSIACQAFEAKLQEVAPAQPAQNMTEVIERLRGLKAASSNESDAFQAGLAEGRRWAMNTAGPDELERLEKFQAQHSPVEWRTLFQTETGWQALARVINPAIAPKHVDRPGREKMFWKRVLEDPRPFRDMDFFRGFAEAAIAVWKEVRDHL